MRKNKATKMTIWISIGKVAKMYGVTTQTIRNWTKQGKLQAKRTMGKHRRYEKEKIEPKTNECENGLTVTYARVSSNDQKEDLALAHKRNCKISNYLHHASSFLITQLRSANIGTLVIRQIPFGSRACL